MTLKENFEKLSDEELLHYLETGSIAYAAVRMEDKMNWNHK